MNGIVLTLVRPDLKSCLGKSCIYGGGGGGGGTGWDKRPELKPADIRLSGVLSQTLLRKRLQEEKKKKNRPVIQIYKVIQQFLGRCSKWLSS